MAKKMNQDIYRSIIFGFEDALVSTTGVVVGISAGTQNVNIILLASFVTIIVEALSMGAGQFITEKSVCELNSRSLFRKTKDVAFLSGIIMFIAYVLGGMIPVIPMIIFPFPISAICATIAALIGLFTLGYIKGKVAKIKPIRSGMEVLIIGGIATIAGLIVGLLFKV